MRETQIDATPRIPLREAFVAQTQIQSADGSERYRRQVHLSLIAAQRAVDRARSRGLAATVRLCRLVPVEDEEADR